jgi:hypothetical protein
MLLAQNLTIRSFLLQELHPLHPLCNRALEQAMSVLLHAMSVPVLQVPPD